MYHDFLLTILDVLGMLHKDHWALQKLKQRANGERKYKVEKEERVIFFITLVYLIRIKKEGEEVNDWEIITKSNMEENRKKSRKENLGGKEMKRKREW